MFRKQANSGKRRQMELQPRPIVINFKRGIFYEDPTQTQMVTVLYCQDLQQHYIQNGSRNQQAFSLEGKGALSCIQI
jgi:hypothetical protein